MTRRYVLPDSAAPYILFQRTAYAKIAHPLPAKILHTFFPSLSYETLVSVEAVLRNRAIKASYLDDMEGEFLSIRDVLPASCSAILDVGCGLAGIDLFLNDFYREKGMEPTFYLLDKTHLEERVYYRYKPQGAFYNSLSLAREILLANGVFAHQIEVREATEKNEIAIDTELDLVLSLISWGFHYPVRTYLDRVYELLRKGGVLLLDIRKGTEGLYHILKKFSSKNVHLVSSSSKSIRLCAVKSDV